MSTRICTIEGCDEPQRARGWCSKHYLRWSRNGTPLGYQPPTECSVCGAAPSSRGLTRGLCTKHYRRYLRHGDPTMTARSTPTDDLKTRIMRRTEKAPGAECWIWQGAKSKGGYGSLAMPGYATKEVHRLSYIAHVGPIPDGMRVDHTCYTPACVNPDHLRLVTPKQNVENRSRPTHPNNTSGYAGVAQARSGRWVARVKHCGTSYYLGTFDTPQEAAEVAREARNRLFTHNDIDRLEGA